HCRQGQITGRNKGLASQFAEREPARNQMAHYQPTSRRPIADMFRATARAPVRWCVQWGVHPDAISYASIGASAATAVCFWQSGQGLPTSAALLIPAAAFCYFRLYLNMLDGM